MEMSWDLYNKSDPYSLGHYVFFSVLDECLLVFIIALINFSRKLKRSDVNGNPFECLLDENNVI